MSKRPDFVLVPRGPFSLARSANVVCNFQPLRHQPANDEGTMRLGFIADRTFAPVAVSLRQEYGGAVQGVVSEGADVEATRKQVARILGLDIDATTYPDVAKRDPKLAPLMKAFEGLRPVSFTSPYECACWAIVSQRISKVQAANVVRGLVDRHGAQVDCGDMKIGVFPTPQTMLTIEAIPSLPAIKVERLRAVAEAALDGNLDAESLRRLPEAEAMTRLKELPGIGEFWASGIWLRACGIANRFPDEPISIAALGALHDLGDHPTPQKLAELTAKYEPFGMWIAFLLRVAANREETGEALGIRGREMAIRKSRGRPAGRRAAAPKRSGAPAA